jgi:hypothetical protein
MKLLFPDACWSKEIISGALFRYFHDQKLGFTLHPSVSTYLTGIDPFDFIRYVENKKPEWQHSFSEFVHIWTIYRSSLQQTSDLLMPLRGTGFKIIWMSYPRGSGAWESAEELLAASELEVNEITKLIDPFSAADELFSHIFFERYLELYEGHRTRDEIFALAGERARSKGVSKPTQVNWAALYQYCEYVFKSDPLEKILTTAYMFRLPILRAQPTVLLSNPNLVSFLSSLPFDTNRARERESSDIDFDVIAWEFFRQLVSPRLDPIDKDCIEKIVQVIKRSSGEIDALKRRCLKLAEDLGSEKNLDRLQRQISHHIRVNVEREVQAVLALDKRTVRDFLDSVFSDEKTWIGIATFLYSLVQGGPVLTAGAAIYALSSIGSKALKAAAERRQKLKINDYALLYRMRQ